MLCNAAKKTKTLEICYLFIIILKERFKAGLSNFMTNRNSKTSKTKKFWNFIDFEIFTSFFLFLLFWLACIGWMVRCYATKEGWIWTHIQVVLEENHTGWGSHNKEPQDKCLNSCLCIGCRFDFYFSSWE